MYGEIQASELTEFIPFICTSAIRGQILVFFLFTLRIGRCVLLALANSSVITMGVETPVGPQFWEPSFTFRGQKSLMVVTFVVYWYGKIYFHLMHLLKIYDTKSYNPVYLNTNNIFVWGKSFFFIMYQKVTIELVKLLNLTVLSSSLTKWV